MVCWSWTGRDPSKPHSESSDEKKMAFSSNSLLRKRLEKVSNIFENACRRAEGELSHWSKRQPVGELHTALLAAALPHALVCPSARRPDQPAPQIPPKRGSLSARARANSPQRSVAPSRRSGRGHLPCGVQFLNKMFPLYLGPGVYASTRFRNTLPNPPMA